MRIYKLISIVGINSFLFIICLNAAFEPVGNGRKSVRSLYEGPTYTREIFRRRALAAEERAAAKAHADSIEKTSLNSSNKAVPSIAVQQNQNLVAQSTSRPASRNAGDVAARSESKVPTDIDLFNLPIDSNMSASQSVEGQVNQINEPINSKTPVTKVKEAVVGLITGMFPGKSIEIVTPEVVEASLIPNELVLAKNEAVYNPIPEQTQQAQKSPIENQRSKDVTNEITDQNKAKKAKAQKPQAPKTIMNEAVPTPDEIQSLIKNQGSEVDVKNRVAEALQIPTLFNSVKAFNDLEVVKPDIISNKQKVLINNIVSYYQSKFPGSLIDPIVQIKQDIKLFESDTKPDIIAAKVLATAAIDQMIQQVTERSYPLQGISIYKSVKTLTDNINEIESNKIDTSISEQSVYQSYEDVYSKIQNSLERIELKVIDVEKDARISEDFAKNAQNQFNEAFKTKKKTDVAKQVQAQINLDIAVQAGSSKKMTPVIDAEVTALTLRIKNRESEALVVQDALTNLIKKLNDKNLKSAIDSNRNIENWSKSLNDAMTESDKLQDKTKALDEFTNKLNGIVEAANEKYTDFADFIEKTEVLQAYIDVIKQLKNVIVENDTQFNKYSKIDTTVDDYLRDLKDENSSKLLSEIQDIDYKIKYLKNMDTAGEQKAIREIRRDIDTNFNGKNKEDLAYFYTQLRTKLEVKKDNVLMREKMAARAPEVIKQLWNAKPQVFEKDLYSYNPDSIVLALENFSNALKDRGLKLQIDKILKDYDKPNKKYPGDVETVVKEINKISNAFLNQIDTNGKEYASSPDTEFVILYKNVIDGLQKMMDAKKALLEGSTELKIQGAVKEVDKLEDTIIVPAPWWRGKDQITRELIEKEIDTLSKLKDADQVIKAIKTFNKNFKATSDEAKSKKIYVPEDNQDFNSVKAYYQRILDGLLEDANAKVVKNAPITHAVLGGVQSAGNSVYQGVAGAGNAAYDAAYDAAAVAFSLPERKKLEGLEKEAFDAKTKEASEKAAEQSLLAATDLIYRRAKQAIAVGGAIATVGAGILYLFPGLKTIALNYGAQTSAIQNNNNLTQDQKDKLKKALWDASLSDASDYIITSTTGLDSTGAHSSDAFTIAQAALVNQALKIADPTTQATYQYDPTTGSASRLNQFKADYDAWVAAQTPTRKTLAITNGPSTSTGTQQIPYYSYEDFVAMEQAHNSKMNYGTQYSPAITSGTQYQQVPVTPSPTQTPSAPYNPYTSSPYLSASAG